MTGFSYKGICVIPDSSVAKGNDFSIDFDQILGNINELNILAGEGISKIQHTIDGARLKVNTFAISLCNY